MFSLLVKLLGKAVRFRRLVLEILALYWALPLTCFLTLDRHSLLWDLVCSSIKWRVWTKAPSSSKGLWFSKTLIIAAIKKGFVPDWLWWPLLPWPVTVLISSLSPHVPVVFWQRMSHSAGCGMHPEMDCHPLSWHREGKVWLFISPPID